MDIIQNNDDNIFDAQGYRYNVGIILLNSRNQAFWGRRCGQNAWQFPQGGMNAGESSEQAMLRELYEETGLQAEHVEILGETAGWLRYRLPLRYRRRRYAGTVQCIGQKQKWFLLRSASDTPPVDLNAAGEAEFDYWQWQDYWQCADKVVHFKQDVYRSALEELAQYVPALAASRPAAGDSPRSKPKAPSFARRRKH